MKHPHIPLAILTVLLSVSWSLGDTIDWEIHAGTLDKPDYTTDAAVYTVTSDEGAEVSFKLRHLNTSAGLFSYSKWEINRWGDPFGFYTPPGSWQVVASEANDYFLGLWGHWGANEAPLELGDSTSYILEIVFDTPVTNLTIPIHGINALIDEYGNNAQDTVIATAFLETSDRAEAVNLSGPRSQRHGLWQYPYKRP